MQAANEMVSQLMHQPVVSAGPGASVGEVLALAQSSGIHHVPIVQRGKLLGMVCTCDLRAARPDVRALQLARRQVVTALPSCTVIEAAHLMLTHLVGSLVISNRDGVWGIVTRHDLEQADPALAQLMAGSCCAACKTTHHLQQGPGETLLCAACAERADSKHWFDCGGGD